MTTEPLTPACCDLSDFPRMMLDIRRLRGSSFDATLNDAAWRAGLNLWMTAWHQIPAGSLEDTEAELTKAAGLGRDVKTWRKLRADALRGWVKCSDGLLYHETIAEIALEAWIDKLGQRLSSGAGNAKRHGIDFDPAPIVDDVKVAAEMLARLNPKSRHMSKSHVVRALAGLPPGETKPPTGKPARTPVRSQGNGMERKVGEASKKASPTDAVRDDERAEGSPPLRLVRTEPDDSERGWLLLAAQARQDKLRARLSDPDHASECAEFECYANAQAVARRRAAA